MLKIILNDDSMANISWIQTLDCGFTCFTKLVVEDPFSHQYLFAFLA